MNASESYRMPLVFAILHTVGFEARRRARYLLIANSLRLQNHPDAIIHTPFFLQLLRVARCERLWPTVDQSLFVSDDLNDDKALERKNSIFSRKS